MTGCELREQAKILASRFQDWLGPWDGGQSEEEAFWCASARAILEPDTKMTAYEELALDTVITLSVQFPPGFKLRQNPKMVRRKLGEILRGTRPVL